MSSPATELTKKWWRHRTGSPPDRRTGDPVADDYLDETAHSTADGWDRFIDAPNPDLLTIGTRATSAARWHRT